MRMKRIFPEFAWLPLRMEEGGFAFLRGVWKAVVVEADAERPFTETQAAAGFYRTRRTAEAGLRERFPDIPFVWEPCA